jgi:TrmH family RNA methyltransferase
MPPADITSTANPRVRRLIGLRKRENRDRDGLFLVEGADIDRAVVAGLAPVEVYYDPARFSSPPHAAEAVFSVEAAALDRASYRADSSGVIAVFPKFSLSIERLAMGPDPLLIVLEAIEKPGNLGAVLRTADAVGADAVIAADPGTDAFNPNVIRASLGALFSVPVATTDVGTALEWLRARGIRIAGADPSGPIGMWEADLTGPCAIAIGSEHEGLSDAVRMAADDLVSIPMMGSTNSLNASVSAALLAYEALRQRTHHP